MSTLSFGSPIFLALAALALPLAWWALVRERRRRVALARFGDESLLAQSSTLPTSQAPRSPTIRHFRSGAVTLGLIGTGPTAARGAARVAGSHRTRRIGTARSLPFHERRG